MDFRTLGKIFLVAALGFLPLRTSAQGVENEVSFEGADPCPRASRIESEIDCFLESRPVKTTTIKHELEITTRIEARPIRTRQCQASVSLSYLQKNTLASVEGEIKNETCAASSGEVVLSVRTANEGGDQATQEYRQPWMRDDDQPVSFSAEYPIGENMDLVRVRALRVQCTCAELPELDAAEEQPE